jgi:glycosyltransferase involved in cell wall biosynthesis
VGSLAWNARVSYAYGLELVKAVRETPRADLRVVIVGDGDGRARLEEAAGPDLGRRVLLTGSVPRHELPSYLETFDVASLPQSVDGVGSFRYTTKMADYLSAGLPIATGQIPLAYDLDEGWMWRLPGEAPWDDRYIEALARLMGTLSRDELGNRRARVPADSRLFAKGAQQERVRAFLREL